MKHICKSILALMLVFAMTLGLVSCAKSPQERFVKAEEKALENTLDTLFESYDSLQTSKESKDQTVVTDVNIEIGTTLLTMLNSLTQTDLAWINDTELHLEITNKEKLAKLKGSLSFMNDLVISANSIVDMETSRLYLAVPELTEKYLFADLAEEGISFDPQLLQGSSDIFEKLPEKKVLRDLIEKYVGMLLNGISDVTAEDTELTIGTTTQNCTALNATITEKAFAELLKTILTELSNDADFKEVFISFADIYYGEIEGYEEDTEALYQYIIGDIDVALKDMEDAMISGDITDETLFTLTTYLGKKDMIIGQKFVSPKDDIEFFYGIAEEDNASELQYYAIIEGKTAFEIKGELTEVKNLLSANLEFFLGDTSMMFIDLENVDAKKLKDGYFNGTISFAPSEGLLALINEAGDDSGFPIGSLFAALSLEIEMKTSENTVDCSASILNGSDRYLTIETKTEKKTASAIEIPSAGEIETDINAWSADIDMIQFISDLETKTELPDSVIGLLYMLITPNLLG